MSYLWHSFTLPYPLRKIKMKLGEKDCDVSTGTLQRRPGLSQSELTLYTSPSNGAEYYGLEKLEDIYVHKKMNYFPDFYGGYPIPQRESHSDYESFTSKSVSHSEYDSVSAVVTSNSDMVSSSSSETLADVRIDEDSRDWGLNKKRQTEFAGETLMSEHYLCRDVNCLNLQNSGRMEAVWETENNMQFPRRREIKWYDRKLRHRSCPPFQAHMVAAFEQSLSNMTDRFQHLTVTAEQKETELGELRNTIDDLKKQSTEAGLTKMALQSMQAVERTMQGKMSSYLSTYSVSSMNSQSSIHSTSPVRCDSADDKRKKKKKGWLRSSFSKAFSRSKKNKNGALSDVEDLKQFHSDSSESNTPSRGPYLTNGHFFTSSHSFSDLYEKEDECSLELMKDLRKQLREKDMLLTDIRLEALTSAHQIESLKDIVNKMKVEMTKLKQDNERLQRLVTSKSLNSSQNSLTSRGIVNSFKECLSTSENIGSPPVDTYFNNATSDRTGKKIAVSAYLCCHGDYCKVKTQHTAPQEVFIGSVSVNSMTKWDLLDNVVKRKFKEYLQRIDPVYNLGLCTESILSYHIGDIVRSKELEVPDLLPCGYLVGDNMKIHIMLKGTKQNSIDALAFETLIPKSLVQRYISLLLEHRRLILCGLSGTGKTFLAQKLAEFLVFRSSTDVKSGALATFSVDHKSAKKLQQYLSNIAEQFESRNNIGLPTVIILDNLHLVGSLSEVFNGFLNAKYQNSPFIIGTMNQVTCSASNLQLHHNFRWVLYANHIEPVNGFLGRFLRRQQVQVEVNSGVQNPELNKILDWIPTVWNHLNKFLETHSSSDVTIGPRLFLSCPLDVSSSQVWFTDLWNYSIIPYLMEAVREGLQLYSRRAPWKDPTEWVKKSYPWSAEDGPQCSQLVNLHPEDVCYEGYPKFNIRPKSVPTSQNEVEPDPLLNMLIRLQEAASCPSPQNDNESLCSNGLCTEDLESTL